MSIRESSIRAGVKFDQICAAYEVHDHQHAVAILTLDFPELLTEICDVLLAFRIGIEHIKKAGGNESQIPKTLSEHLRPLGWEERKLRAEQIVDGQSVSADTHKIDYVKDQVAFDLEWNSKDQTFDRDLYAFRAFFDYRKIAAAVLLTRSLSLDSIFRELGSYTDPTNGKDKTYLAKYGASTTHMGQLLRRLQAGRSGGCPILALGITPKQITR